MRLKHIDAIENKNHNAKQSGAFSDEVNLKDIEDLGKVFNRRSKNLQNGKGVALYRDKGGKLSIIGVEGSE
jgi:hypothetical protein